MAEISTETSTELSIRARVTAILAEQAMMAVSEVKQDATLDDLGIDSIGLVEAIFAIEEAFDIQVPFNANEPDAPGLDIRNVASIIAAVEGFVTDQRP
ncbi:MAG: phosphopantetheine-binding protein [Pseudomonadota bacterium]